MLVLSRKVSERIAIGNNITIVVNKISGNRVSLAIDAPASVRIRRGELPAFDEGFDDAEIDPNATVALPPGGLDFTRPTNAQMASRSVR